MRRLLFCVIPFLCLSTPSFAACKGCDKLAVSEDSEYDLLVLTSFSVPDAVWISHSQEMEGRKAAFVVRGLPGNSFREFASRVALLKKKGMMTPVLVDPRLFREHRVEAVPTFLFFQGKEVHQLRGNITLRAADEILRRMG